MIIRMEKTKINLLGFDVDVCNYGNATYLYPSFNGNFEVRANHKGFRKLSHYLRTIRWINKMREELFC